MTLLAAALARAIVAGVLKNTGMPINVAENFQPLFGLLVDGREIERLGPRQYGVVAFLSVDPIVRLYGRDPVMLNLWALLLCLIGIGVAFALLARRYGARTFRALVVLGILWAGFLPIIDALATRLFDLPVLGLLAATLYFYTASGPARGWSGVTAAAAFLTKLLPILFLPLLLARERLAFTFGVAAIVVFLLIGQVLYGLLMGLAYPYFLLTSTPGSIYKFSFQGENDSLRGLLFKIAAGFRAAPGGQVATPPQADLVHYFAFGLEVLLLGYLFYVVFRYRRSDGLDRRSIEFALAIVTMYLIAPHAAHEHMVSMVIVFTIIGWLWLSRPDSRSPAVALMTLCSLFLIGVYAPVSLVAGALSVEQLMRWAGNEASEFFGSSIAGYNFLGFPGYGLILVWIALVVLERRTRVARLRASQ